MRKWNFPPKFNLQVSQKRVIQLKWNFSWRRHQTIRELLILRTFSLSVRVTCSRRTPVNVFARSDALKSIKWWSKIGVKPGKIPRGIRQNSMKLSSHLQRQDRKSPKVNRWVLHWSKLHRGNRLERSPVSHKKLVTRSSKTSYKSQNYRNRSHKLKEILKLIKLFKTRKTKPFYPILKTQEEFMPVKKHMPKTKSRKHLNKLSKVLNNLWISRLKVNNSIRCKFLPIWILPKSLSQINRVHHSSTKKSQTREETKEQPWNHLNLPLAPISIHVQDRVESSQTKTRYPEVSSNQLTDINKSRFISNIISETISNKSRSNNCFKTRLRWTSSNNNSLRFKLWKTNNCRILNKLFCCNNSGCSNNSSLRLVSCNSCSKS